MKQRLRSALRWNEPQRTACALLTILNCVAALSRDEPSLLAWIIALALWPTFVCVANFVSPLPEECR